MKNVLLTFTVQTFVEAETDQDFQNKKDELLDDLEVDGIFVVDGPVECGRDRLN